MITRTQKLKGTEGRPKKRSRIKSNAQQDCYKHQRAISNNLFTTWFRNNMLEILSASKISQIPLCFLKIIRCTFNWIWISKVWFTSSKYLFEKQWKNDGWMFVFFIQLHLLIFSLLLTSNKHTYWDMKLVSIPIVPGSPRIWSVLESRSSSHLSPNHPVSLPETK